MLTERIDISVRPDVCGAFDVTARAPSGFYHNVWIEGEITAVRLAKYARACVDGQSPALMYGSLKKYIRPKNKWEAIRAHRFIQRVIEELPRRIRQDIKSKRGQACLPLSR